MGATRSTNIELIRGAAAELHEALFVIVRQLLNPKSGVVGHDAIMAGRRALLHAGSVVDLPDYGKRQGPESDVLQHKKTEACFTAFLTQPEGSDE